MKTNKMKLYGQAGSGIYTDYNNVIGSEYSYGYKKDGVNLITFLILATTDNPDVSYVLGKYEASERRDYVLKKCVEADQKNQLAFTFEMDEELKRKALDA